MNELIIVPSERHVERLARAGVHAETRRRFLTRLTTSLLPDIAFANGDTCRLLLSVALGAPHRGQLELYAREPSAAEQDPLLAAARARGGASWVRLCGALDDAITVLRGRGVTAEVLDRVVGRASGVARARASTFAASLRALDAHLSPSRDERLLPSLLSDALRASGGDDVERMVGSRSVRARYVLDWEPADAAVWRALDEKLAPRGGGARVVLPGYERALEGARVRDDLELLTESVAELLDSAPESGIVEELDVARVTLGRTMDLVGQARFATQTVLAAIGGGAPVESIVIALPTLDEGTLGPLRRALDEAGVVAYESRGAVPSESPVIVTAMLALDLSTALERRGVARLLRSGYVDGDPHALLTLARTLDTTPSAPGEDAITSLVRTAGSSAQEAARVASILTAGRAARTRVERVRAARAMYGALGLGARAGRGALATFARDEAPTGVARAERTAIARDARAWDALATTLDRYEALAASDEVISDETFRLELLDALDAASAKPAAGRAGAVRIARVAELAGDEIDILVVLDANEGLLPRDDPHGGLVSAALSDAIARASRGAIPAPRDRIRRARELGALALATANARRVVFAFSAEDASGARLEPSQIVADLARRGARTEDVRAVRSSCRTDIRARRERLREAFFLDPQRPRSEIVATLQPSEEIAQILRDETGGGGRPLAATSLERFARCGFMGYAHVVLAAREQEAADELPDAREEGIIVHDALAAAFEATRELWAARPRRPDVLMARAMDAATLALARSEGRAPLRALSTLRARDAVRAVVQLAIDDDTWDFCLAEQSFGGRETDTWPALVVEMGALKLAVRGTIDRIDRGHGGLDVRVVDYKRSLSTVRAAAGALGSTALQVPLYARVAARALGLPSGGTYMPFQARDIAASGGAAPRAFHQVRELAEPDADGLSLVERRALFVVGRARAGDIAPIPADDTECRTCAVSGGCRKPRFAMSADEEVEEGS